MVLAQGPLAGTWAFGLDLFGLLDATSGQFLLPAAGLALALYTAYQWGFRDFARETNAGARSLRVNALWRPLIVVVIPAAVTLVVLMGWGLLG